ncbi:HNH endonuclease signature motif containing protein [Corynebacterium pacaense]|uniref:HNH endonuclease signature motif containing protein n=1 Tax=Corynebacterium pacaense TaxID=1816684 RepID=UPI00117789C6|nr:HNH endonuclease signature motif containing protein [Corynebacterium pacaense]
MTLNLDLLPPELGGENPGAYYSVNDRNDPVAFHSRVIVYNHYLLWMAFTGNEDEDAGLSFRQMARRTGVGERKAERYLDALAMLGELPSFSGLISVLWHVDLDVMAAITVVLNEVDPEATEIFTEIDRRLTQFLTPKRANQWLPSKKKILKEIRAWIRELDPAIANGENSAKDTESLGFRTSDFDMTIIEGVLDPVDGAVVEAAIHEYASENGVSAPQALIELITGAVAPKVVLNVFTINDEDAPIYMDGPGYLDYADEQRIRAQVSLVRDMNRARDMRTDSYVVPEGMKLYCKARDGHCVVPGCTVSAFRCDCDHIRNHADGGPTSPCNICDLCRYHHNQKTEGRLKYRLDEEEGVVYFTEEDGTETASDLDGPFSPMGLRWMRTVAQKRRARRNAARKRATGQD